jgi:hypothetical protein
MFDFDPASITDERWCVSEWSFLLQSGGNVPTVAQLYACYPGVLLTKGENDAKSNHSVDGSDASRSVGGASHDPRCASQGGYSRGIYRAKSALRLPPGLEWPGMLLRLASPSATKCQSGYALLSEAIYGTFAVSVTSMGESVWGGMTVKSLVTKSL